jgi:hypothetical protein
MLMLMNSLIAFIASGIGTYLGHSYCSNNSSSHKGDGCHWFGGLSLCTYSWIITHDFYYSNSPTYRTIWFLPFTLSWIGFGMFLTSVIPALL